MHLIRNHLTLVHQLYVRLVPLEWRRQLWSVYWLLVSLRKDYTPQSLIWQDYDHYWEGRTQRPEGISISYRDLIPLCVNEIPEQSRVLDFGCGSGELLVEVTRVRHITGLGLDISARAVQLASQRGIDAREFHLTNCDDLRPFGHFDVAIATEVLEHLQHAELVLVALARSADRVLVSIPNTGYLNYRLRLLAGRFPRQWHQHPAEHVRFWTLADFRYTVQSTGLHITKVVGVAGGRLGRLYPSLFAPDLFFVISSSYHDLQPCQWRDRNPQKRRTEIPQSMCSGQGQPSFGGSLSS